MQDSTLDHNAGPPPAPTYFRSKLPDIYIPDHRSLAQYCLQRAPTIADRPCLLQGKASKTYTYGEVQSYARRVASGLANIGVEKGESVMLLLPNCAEFVLVFLGAAWRGAMVTICNSLYTKGKIGKQLTGSACVEKLTSIVGDRPHVKMMGIERTTYVGTPNSGAGDVGTVMPVPMPAESEHVPCGGHIMHISELIEADEGGCPEVEIDPVDIVALPYSSGTSGLPKGVMLTHRGLETSIAQQVDGDNPNLWIREDEVMLCVHVYYRERESSKMRLLKCTVCRTRARP